MNEADKLKDRSRCLKTIRKNFEKILFVHVAPREEINAHGNNCCDVTRPARLKLALEAMKKGEILVAFRLGVLSEIKRKSPRAAIQIGHLLKDAGQLDLALVTYAKVVLHAQDEKMVCEALLHLGHCAKIAGKYAVAVEAFAYNRQLICDGTDLARASLDDLSSTVECLTGSFSIR